MKKIVHRSHVRRINLNVQIYGSVLKKIINAMEFQIVTTEVMNLDVLQLSQINAIKRSISDAKLLEFVSQLLGIVTEATIVTIIVMSKSAAQLHARIISSSVKMENAYLKLTFAMEKMTVEITAMSLMSTLVFRHHLDVQ